MGASHLLTCLHHPLFRKGLWPRTHLNTHSELTPVALNDPGLSAAGRVLSSWKHCSPLPSTCLPEPVPVAQMPRVLGLCFGIFLESQCEGMPCHSWPAPVPARSPCFQLPHLCLKLGFLESIRPLGAGEKCPCLGEKKSPKGLVEWLKQGEELRADPLQGLRPGPGATWVVGLPPGSNWERQVAATPLGPLWVLHAQSSDLRRAGLSLSTLTNGKTKAWWAD